MSARNEMNTCRGVVNYDIQIETHNRIEISVLILYLVSQLVVLACHEPWFDEAQAWQISRYETYYNIIFRVPHYEGHPPLWHLLLSIPAKTGVPYEAGLKSINFIISAIVGYLILFHSPFPRMIKCLIPFNYFFFYQYGVISRPYSLLVLLLFLLAMEFKNKDSKPGTFILLLSLLCLTHAYGLVMAGGIALCWTIDILNEKGINGAFKEIFRDRRTRGLIILLLIAILIIIEIMPREDTYAVNAEAKNSLWERIACTLFTMLPDCLLLKSMWFSDDKTLLSNVVITWYALIPAVVIGIAVWFTIWSVSPGKLFKYYALPYLLFAVFGAILYMTAHHIGLSLGLFTSWLWTIWNDENKFENWKKIEPYMGANSIPSGTVKIALAVLEVACLLVPVYWTARSSYGDIKEEYSYGRNLSKFLKNTGLDETLILVQWNQNVITEESNNFFTMTNPTLLAYFDGNIVANSIPGYENYLDHQLLSQEKAISILQQWKNLDIPDVLIGEVDISGIYGNRFKYDDYSIVYDAKLNYYFKDDCVSYDTLIYVRNDLLEQYHLTSIENPNVLRTNINITGSIIEAYNNGELTVDEIVDMMIGDFGK